MATIFWNFEGILLVDFLERRKTVTGAYYVEILRKLGAELAKKHSGGLNREILFHCYNASVHSSHVAKEILRVLNLMGIAATPTL